MTSSALLRHTGLLVLCVGVTHVFHYGARYVGGLPLDDRVTQVALAHIALLIGGAVFTRPGRFAESIGARAAWTAFAVGNVLAEIGLLGAFLGLGRAAPPFWCFLTVVVVAGSYARWVVRPAPLSKNPRRRTNKASRLVVVKKSREQEEVAREAR